MTIANKTAANSRAKALASRGTAQQISLAVPSSEGGGRLRLSDPALKPEVARLKEKLRSDPAFALETLQSAGIATAAGRLTKRYKG